MNGSDAPKPAAPGVGDTQEGLEKQITTAFCAPEVLHGLRSAGEGDDIEACLGQRAAKQVGTQLQAVSEVARKNPGTTATVLGGVGIVSFLLGVAVGLALAVTRHRWYT